MRATRVTCGLRLSHGSCRRCLEENSSELSIARDWGSDNPSSSPCSDLIRIPPATQICGQTVGFMRSPRPDLIGM